MADRKTTEIGTRRRSRPNDPRAKSPAGETLQETKEEVREGLEEVKSEAGEKGREIRRTAEERADRWTERAGHQASSVARALRVAARDLEEGGDERLAHWGDGAADEVEKMAGYLEAEDPRSMFSDLERLARRNPAAFLGGTFATGLLLGRFLRASEPDGEARLPQDGPVRDRQGRD